MSKSSSTKLFFLISALLGFAGCMLNPPLGPKSIPSLTPGPSLGCFTPSPLMQGICFNWGTNLVVIRSHAEFVAMPCFNSQTPPSDPCDFNTQMIIAYQFSVSCMANTGVPKVTTICYSPTQVTLNFTEDYYPIPTPIVTPGKLIIIPTCNSLITVFGAVVVPTSPLPVTTKTHEVLE
jgi:hypothetical protein